MGTPSLAYSACLYIASVREGVGARVVLVILALLVTVQAGEAMAHEHPDRFSLYTGCDSMELRVEVDIENSSLSLSAEAVRSAAEARLRSARLYQAGDGDSGTLPNQYLLVVVAGASVAFSVRLQFYRILVWPGPSKHTDWWRQEYPDGSEPVGYASTWRRTAVGTHDGTSTVVLSVVSQFTDAFLVDYLRMNEEDC